MALNQGDAEMFAQKVLIALAENGAIKLNGPSSNSEKALTVGRAERDAAYISELFHNVVSGLQG